MSRKRRLHVWEHHSLHPQKATSNPVHIVYDDHEFDYWWRDEPGTLHIGFQYEAPKEDEHTRDRDIKEGLTGTYIKKVDHTQISSFMVAKIWEEEYEEEPTKLYDQTELPETTVEFTPSEAREALVKQFTDEDEGYVPARSRFPDEHPIISEEEMMDPGKTQLIMPLVREEKLDKTTGLNLTHLVNQIQTPVVNVDAGLSLLVPKDTDDEEAAKQEKEDSLLGLKTSDVA